MPKGHFSGMTGVYYAAAELSSRGFIVAVTSRNAPGIDIISTNDEGKRFDIQVKTNSEKGTHSFWLLSERAKTDQYPNLLYIFINLKEKGQRPDFYIVRSSEVASGMNIDTSRKTGSIWHSFPRREEDKERWDLLS